MNTHQQSNTVCATETAKASDCIYEWLRERPEVALPLAWRAAVMLMTTDDGALFIGEDESFISGSDYIDEMTDCMEEQGVFEFINSIR